MRTSPITLFWRDGDKLMNHNSEYLPGSASLPTSPVAPVAPSSAVASRLARSSSDSQAEKGTHSEYESDDAEINPQSVVPFLVFISFLPAPCSHRLCFIQNQTFLLLLSCLLALQT